MYNFFIIIALIVGAITLILLYGSLAFAVFSVLYEWYVKNKSKIQIKMKKVSEFKVCLAIAIAALLISIVSFHVFNI